ncbi:MAG: hypothetical protein IT449_12585 [Phycisphaerales bacterium]|nr:hypothetical protein [Phycisphaerales bacterium]
MRRPQVQKLRRRWDRAGQAEHHKKEDFKAELLRMLRLHEIEFDEKYMFD